MGLGLALRRVSLPVCLVVGALWTGWTLIHALTGHDRGFPNLIPFHAGGRIGLAAWVLSGLVALVVLFLVLRLLAMAIGALGWWLLPPEHRDTLSRLSSPGQSDSGNDPSRSGDDMAQMRVACSTGESGLAVRRL